MSETRRDDINGLDVGGALETATGASVSTTLSIGSAVSAFASDIETAERRLSISVDMENTDSFASEAGSMSPPVLADDCIEDSLSLDTNEVSDSLIGGTPAAEMTDETSYETKMERLKRLKTRIDELENVVAEKMVGTIQRVVVENISKKDKQELAGRTDNNRVVNFVGSADLLGRFVEVRILAVSMHTLRGELAG